MMQKFKVALVQMDTRDDVDQNLAKMMKFIKEAAAKGAKVICFPEFSNFLPFSRGNMYFEERKGRTTSLLQKLAKELDVYIHTGAMLLDSGSDRPYNESAMIYPDGSIHDTYRKIHLYKGIGANGKEFQEESLYTRGEEILVDEFEGIPYGTAICYDSRFSEIFRIMAGMGAKIFFIPGNFTEMSGNTFLFELLIARAVENEAYVICANQVGEKAKTLSLGHSMVVSPKGEVLALRQGAEGEGILYCDLDIDEVDRQRTQVPLYDQQRQDVYEKYRGQMREPRV